MCVKERMHTRVRAGNIELENSQWPQAHDSIGWEP